MMTVSGWLLRIGGVSFVAFVLTFLWMNLLSEEIPDPHGPMGYWFVCTTTVLVIGAAGFLYCTFMASP